MMTGGLALDKGLVAALEEDVANIKDMKIDDPQPSRCDLCRRRSARPCGARIRFEKLAALGNMPKAA